MADPIIISNTSFGIAGWVSFGLTLGMAIYERLRNARLNTAKQANEAKDELLKVITADRDAQKSRYELEHSEYIKYREGSHEIANKANARILTLTDENAQLRAKTDITPLLEHQKEQSSINTKILTSLDLVIAHLTELQSHHPPHEPRS